MVVAALKVWSECILTGMPKWTVTAVVPKRNRLSERDI